MASNGAPADFSVPNILAAVLTMRGGDADKKKVAVDYLRTLQNVSRVATKPTPFGPVLDPERSSR